MNGKSTMDRRRTIAGVALLAVGAGGAWFARGVRGYGGAGSGPAAADRRDVPALIPQPLGVLRLAALAPTGHATLQFQLPADDLQALVLLALPRIAGAPAHLLPLAAMIASPSEADARGLVSGSVTLDLVQSLGLPASAGRYDVFVVADAFRSNALPFQSAPRT
jgi:hypothetical protein